MELSRPSITDVRNLERKLEASQASVNGISYVVKGLQAVYNGVVSTQDVRQSHDVRTFYSFTQRGNKARKASGHWRNRALTNMVRNSILAPYDTFGAMASHGVGSKFEDIFEGYYTTWATAESLSVTSEIAELLVEGEGEEDEQDLPGTVYATLHGMGEDKVNEIAVLLLGNHSSFVNEVGTIVQKALSHSTSGMYSRKFHASGIQLATAQMNGLLSMCASMSDQGSYSE